LVNAYDFDLNDPEMLTAITQIKPSLANAIAHDIASNGKAVAEVVDAELKETCMQDLAKLILVSSLADVPNALLRPFASRNNRLPVRTRERHYESQESS
jgi:hypothetical protein